MKYLTISLVFTLCINILPRFLIVNCAVVNYVIQE